MKIKCVITEIDWDTDGEEIEGLPANVTLELEDLDGLGVSDEDVADELSDRYGFCVNSFYCDKYDEDGSLVDEFGDKINEIEDKVS
jgi:hypothetical protein